MPSACRAPHVRRCVGRMLSNTTHRDFDLCIVVSQDTPLDATQCETLRVLTADARARVMRLEVAAFNYAQANNFAARGTDAAYICLLNDDVLPMDPHWLTRMVGHFADPAVGVVGAKLYYPNATIQHGGVLMGSGGLPDHINRFLPRRAPGYASRAILSQQVSAVTGACMVVRRDVFESVGGLDETFPIAFNDVDFCLRVASAGWSVVFCADAELFHYKSLSLGHHFAGERATAEQVEAGRMRARWGHVTRADPYHNPNLSLQKGHEWTLALPPKSSDQPTGKRPRHHGRT